MLKKHSPYLKFCFSPTPHPRSVTLLRLSSFDWKKGTKSQPTAAVCGCVVLVCVCVKTRWNDVQLTKEGPNCPVLGTKSHVITVLSLDAKRDELGTSNIRCSKYAGELTEQIDKKKKGVSFKSCSFRKCGVCPAAYFSEDIVIETNFFLIFICIRRLEMQFLSTS